MIGLLKPRSKEHFQTLAIGTDPNVMFFHYLRSKGSFMKKFDIEGQVYFHTYEKYFTQSEETETTIYNMVLELENINLFTLCKEIRNKGGQVIDVNTDCAVCTFPNNEFPFSVNDLGNIEGYYHDENIYKYRLEAKSERITTQALPQWIRKQTYEYTKPEWHTVPDSGDNDFMPMVHKILDSNKSINIEGSAGTGKSTFIKQLHEEMNKRKI